MHTETDPKSPPSAPQKSSVAKTAYYCCGIRMLDAASPRSVCNDIYARTFMGEEGLAIFKTFKLHGRSTNRVRPRIIDDWLRRELQATPDLQIILIGAGFDSRAYRLPGGSWVEIDEPAMIEDKNRKLGVDQCLNPLQRIPVTFGTRELRDTLNRLSGRQPTIFIVEGVFMYLEPGQITELLETMQAAFPKHRLFCDLMSPRFVNLWVRLVEKRFLEMGAHIKSGRHDQKALILEKAYRPVRQVSNYERAAQFGITPIPLFIIKYVLRSLGGYCVYEFEYDGTVSNR